MKEGVEDKCNSIIEQRDDVIESITNMTSQSGRSHVYSSNIRSVAKKRNVLVEEGEEVAFISSLLRGRMDLKVPLPIVTFVGRRRP